MSPGDPSTLTGRAAPSGSRAEQGRSVFAEPPTVSWLFRQALRSQLESNKTRPFFALSPAPLPCTPVRATCSLGEVTLSAGPQGGRACHPLPPPRSLFLAGSGERRQPRGASLPAISDLRCEARTAQSGTCLHRALPPPHQHIAVLHKPRPGGVTAPGQRDGHLRPKVLSGIRIGPWR